MKTSRALLLVLLVIVVIGAFSATLVIRRGFSATNEPSPFETALARGVRNLAIPVRARNQKDPLEATSQNLEDGRQMEQICGSGGRGLVGRCLSAGQHKASHRTVM
jgi:hypothetical protein